MPPAARPTPWRRSWYPVAYLKDLLSPGRPTPFTLLGDEPVLWYDQPANQWSAFADPFPPARAPAPRRLKRTRELECPYPRLEF